MATQHFEVTLKRSGAGRIPTQRKTLAALGLTKFGKVIYLKDTPQNRGMLYSVHHLISVQPKSGEPPQGARARARAASKKAPKTKTSKQ